ARSDLGRANEHQHLAEVLVLEQHEMLMLGLQLVEHLLDRIAHAEAEVVEQRFRNPALVGHSTHLVVVDVALARRLSPPGRAAARSRRYAWRRRPRATRGCKRPDRPCRT